MGFRILMYVVLYFEFLYYQLTHFYDLQRC